MGILFSQEQSNNNVSTRKVSDSDGYADYTLFLYVCHDADQEHVNAIKEKYANRRTFIGDAGVDLYCPSLDIKTHLNTERNQSFLVQLGVKCNMVFGDVDYPYQSESCSYWLASRSSIYKTPFMQCNGVGVMDAGYRGEVCVALVCTRDVCWEINTFDRLVQIVAPTLGKIKVVVVDTRDDLDLAEEEDDEEHSNDSPVDLIPVRGNNGFGSTGK